MIELLRLHSSTSSVEAVAFAQHSRIACFETFLKYLSEGQRIDQIADIVVFLAFKGAENRPGLSAVHEQNSEEHA